MIAPSIKLKGSRHEDGSIILAAHVSTAKLETIMERAVDLHQSPSLARRSRMGCTQLAAPLLVFNSPP